MVVNLFYFLSFLAVLSALMVVISKNPVHGFVLDPYIFHIVRAFILMNAQFIAIVNLIVYAGAIMVLFLFTIMFLNLKDNCWITDAIQWNLCFACSRVCWNIDFENCRYPNSSCK